MNLVTRNLTLWRLNPSGERRLPAACSCWWHSWCWSGQPSFCIFFRLQNPVDKPPSSDQSVDQLFKKFLHRIYPGNNSKNRIRSDQFVMGYWTKMVNCTLKWMTAGLQINEAFFVFFPWFFFSGLVITSAATSAASCLISLWTGVVFRSTGFWNRTGRKQLVKAKFIAMFLIQKNKMHLKKSAFCILHWEFHSLFDKTKPNQIYFS